MVSTGTGGVGHDNDARSCATVPTTTVPTTIYLGAARPLYSRGRNQTLPGLRRCSYSEACRENRRVRMRVLQYYIAVSHASITNDMSPPLPSRNISVNITNIARPQSHQ